MVIENNELLVIKRAIFTLVCQLERNLSDDIVKGRIDSQALYALTKLIDSFMKLSDAKVLPHKSANNSQDQLSSEDQDLLRIYGYLKMAPRAGLEPATERLTAVCSTTELPGN